MRNRPREIETRSVGHFIHTYLGRSATFIHTFIRFQRRFQPVVFAKSLEHLDEFPLDSVTCLFPELPLYRRVFRYFPQARDPFWQFMLARGLKRHDCILLHAHYGWNGRRVLDVAARVKIPLVTTFYGRDLAPDLAARHDYEPLFSRGALFFCEGPAMARSLEGLGCPPDKVRVVKIGIDLECFPFRPRPRSEPLIILQIARFVEKKGVDLSIRAYAAARPHLGPSELWLIGDGVLGAELKSRSESLGISSSTRFFGMLSHAECQQMIDRAHVCIQPSRTAANGDTEGGAPTVLIEMQAAGIPVVATKHADIPAVVAEPEALVDEEDVAGLAEQLTRLARLPEDEWSALALKGRRLVEREHDARRVAERVYTLYSEALGEVVSTT